MADAADETHFVFENRLATFQNAHPVAKKRGSNASSRAPKALHWPHKSLSPIELARAGFLFDPFPGSPDNVVCFLCSKSLDGWEEDDKPLEEHLKHSPTCGWAIMAAIEAELGDYGKVHPLEPAMIEARKATFGGKWPYEAKKGFKCKTKQLAEAGWKYTPTLESDDMATCAYCQLALDGWEPGDKPIDEHYKRSPDCPFFALISQYPPPKKAGRGKAAVRPSKAASRLSMQSVATVATGISDLTTDLTVDHDDSAMTTASTMTQGGRKAAKPRKAAAGKGRKTKAKKEEVVEILEDEPQELQEPPAPKPARGRKRASGAMEDSVVTNAEAPAAKKRHTRVRGSTNVDNSAAATAPHDVEMDDIPPTQPTAGRKKGKTTRKASQSSVRSQASTASLRGNNDDDIDRQLQADLERPLTDDEDLAADSDSERKNAPPPPPPKGRPKKAATTRKASGQKSRSKAFAMLDPAPAALDEADIEADFKAMEAKAEQQEVPAVAETETSAVPKKGRKAGPQKVSKQTKKVKELPPPPESVDELMDDPVAAPEPSRVAVPEAVQEPEPEAADDPDASTGTVVNKSAGRPSLEKRGRGRPSKKSMSMLSAVEEPEPRRSSGVPVQIEVQLEPLRDPGSFTAVQVTPATIARKPVPAPAPAPAPAMAAPPPAPTPARTEKALPPPPPHSATRLPRPPTTPRKNTTPSASARQAAISPSQSPQSSDAENQPPSSKPAACAIAKRVVLAPIAATPMRGSPSKRNIVASLQSTTPWAPVDLDLVFSPSQLAEKENGVDKLLRKGGELTSPEKRMTVEEWIYHNAGLAEQKLKHDCETMVTAFEKEGTRAIHTLEGLVVD